MLLREHHALAAAEYMDFKPLRLGDDLLNLPLGGRCLRWTQLHWLQSERTPRGAAAYFA